MDFDELEEVEDTAVQQADAERAAKAEKLAAERRAALAADREKAKPAEPEPKVESKVPKAAESSNGVNGNGEVHSKLPMWEIVPWQCNLKNVRSFRGADKGGILVRDGESTSSTQLPDRLSTGAIVEQLALKGQRLQYELKKGTGPQQGWISISLSGKDLAVPYIVHVAVLPRDSEPRCAHELTKAPVSWTPVSHQQLQEKHMQLAPGLMYNMEFPFTAELLQKMGPAWLTKAFHTARSIPEDNKVKVLKNVKESWMTGKLSPSKEYIGGGNCAKLIFDVEYEKDAPDLHTKLFAKIPFPLAGNTLSDRMASSVMQSGAEIGEINAQRLLESRLPFQIPRYYFADVSNETSNWILITERIPFGLKDTRMAAALPGCIAVPVCAQKYSYIDRCM
eukprot:s4605_g3.t1